MIEKTIPLSKVKIEPRRAIKPTNKNWGEDRDYRALFEQTGECVFIIGLDLCYIAANPQGLELLGYTENELTGMPVSNIMSLDDELGQEVWSGNRTNLYERILKRKDGSRLPVEIRTSIVSNDRNEPSYIQSIARDVSERKSAEQILIRHSRILSAISDSTARLLRTSNIETKIPEMLQSLGKAMDVSCCTIFEINTFSTNPTLKIHYQWNKQIQVDFDVVARIEPIIRSLLNTPDGFLSTTEATSSQYPSSDFIFSITPIQVTLGSWVFLGIFDQKKDLSIIPFERDAIRTAANLIGSAMQRNRYEETIRLNEARNRIIIGALPDVLIRIDIQGYILDYSANPEHSLYIDRELISDKKLTQIWPDQTVKMLMGDSNEFEFKDTHVVEGFHLPINNRIYESRLYPISSNEALIVIRDVTEQERLKQAKTDFINRASHELRTPLTSAIIMVDLIQEGGTPEEIKEYLQNLNSELNRQKILIDRLLMAGRLDDGEIKLERTPMDVISVLKESIQAIKPIANKRRISLNFEAQKEVMIVLGDKSGLQQVFINLINNATKFSPEGNSVDIKAFDYGSEVHVSISDHGLGIPSDALPHLFERFYRAKNVTIAEIPGSGIGLYIVKSILETLGGSIKGESEQNKGTTFTVCLIAAK